MKPTKRLVHALLVLIVALALGGCKKNPDGLTYLPGQKGPVPADAELFPLEGAGPESTTTDSGTFPPSGETMTEEIGLPPIDSSEPLSSSLGDPEEGTIGMGTGARGEDWGPDGNFYQDPDIFSANTVYFDFDRSEVKSSERFKVEEVAIIMREKAGHRLVVDGHCDERGTEEYNRALGERRALSIREYIVNLGVGADRVITRSFGEDMPADPRHDEAAWAKNRRGEFILLIPKNP